jgi:hypothetical protein
MDHERAYWVTAPNELGEVEAWSGYPLQFDGQRRFPWQTKMAADLRQALATLTVTPGDALAGTYFSTDPARCDVENRLFTNVGTSSFPKGLATIRFERGAGPPPSSPVPISLVNGTCTTTGTVSAEHGNRGNPQRRWHDGTGYPVALPTTRAVGRYGWR